MRVAIVGYGVQGNKRQRTIDEDCIGCVDPLYFKFPRKNIEQVPLDHYDAAFVCTDYLPKFKIIKYLLKNKKHVLVEKPLWVPKEKDFDTLERLANKNKVVLYTAYNHRFEPAFVAMRNHIYLLGKVYRCRISYGFGTAKLAQNTWRDRPPVSAGWEILPHLLDSAWDWFGIGEKDFNFDLSSSACFENKRPDHVVITSHPLTIPQLEFEASYVSWRNHFTCDVYGENGSAHIDGLCKWGPSTFSYRARKLPSGRPDEHNQTWLGEDPTWETEYRYFQKLVFEKKPVDLSRDRWIWQTLNGLL